MMEGVRDSIDALISTFTLPLSSLHDTVMSPRKKRNEDMRTIRCADFGDGKLSSELKHIPLPETLGQSVSCGATQAYIV